MLPGLAMLGLGGGEQETIVTENLGLHLDAGDSASYGGSGQTWSDLTANGFDFFVGETVGAEANDPTFNGVAGAKSSAEYFSYDGGDWHQQAAAYSGSIMRKIGRNDTAFAIEMWLYHIAGAIYYAASTSDGGVVNSGFGYEINRAAGKSNCVFQPANSLAGASTTAMTTATWNQVGMTGKADGSTGNYILNGTLDGTWTKNNSSFTAGDSTSTMRIGCSGRATSQSPFLNTQRLAIVRIYSGLLTAAQVLQNYNFNKTRFGL